MGSIDYIWHNIDIDLALNLHRPISQSTSLEIKRAVIYALTLDENWDKPVSRISRIRQLTTVNHVFGMRPLGPNWVVAAYDGTGGAPIRLSLLHLHDAFEPCDQMDGTSGHPNSESSLQLDPVEGNSFECSIQSEKNLGIISVVGGSMQASFANFPSRCRSTWTVYLLDMNDDVLSAKPESLPNEPGVLKEYEIQHAGAYCENLLCTAGPISVTMSFVAGPNKYNVLLLNTDTNVTLQVGYTGVQPEDIQICLPYIIFTASVRKKIEVKVRELPKELFSNKLVEFKPYQEDADIPWAQWESSVVDYESDTWQPADSVRCARVHGNMDNFTELKSITTLACRCSWNGTTNLEEMAVFHFPVDTSRRNVHITEWKATYTFSIPSLNGTWYNFMGPTGRHTICFSEQRINNRTEEVTMKASLPTNRTTPPIVHPLLVPEMNLPFDTHQCFRIYLEEATGRLFVTLKTGGAYLLELGSTHHHL